MRFFSSKLARATSYIHYVQYVKEPSFILDFDTLLEKIFGR